MNDHWLEIILGAGMALLAWLGKRLHDKVDEHDRTHVTRAELKEAITEMREDRQRMHEQNRADLHYIRERVDSIADGP